jgi:Carboxypeptidase regulatory-like domain
MRSPNSSFRSLVACVEGALLVAGMYAPILAQRVAGVVRDSLTGEPLTGAVVSVLDSAGGLVTRDISDAEGRFSLARLTGSRLSVIRIGYAPHDTRLAAGDSSVTVPMRAIPAALSVVTATSRRVCPGDTAGGQALALWEQVRSALLASLLARELNAPRIGLMSFSRSREPLRKRIEDETRESKFVVADRPYVAGRPPWAFAYHGYLTEETGGDRTYYAPDEAVLLDETFAGTHCLRAVSGTNEHRDEIGIGFEPTTADGRDTLVDVKGVLWVDRAVHGLRSLEFEYTGLEPLAAGSGGELTFRVMPNGAPMIQRWLIHSAILATDAAITATGLRRRPRPRPERTNVRLLGYQETGGEIGSAEWANGVKWRAAFPQYRGAVVDSLGRPVSGAVVRLENSTFDDSLFTDASGRFNFPPLRLGFYRLYVADSLLAQYGFSTALPRQVILGPDDETVTLRLRPRAEMMYLACRRDGSYLPGTAIIVGRVVDSDGEPATDVEVDVSWRGAVAGTSSNAQRHTNTDDMGRFAICGAAPNAAVDVDTRTRRQSASVHLDELKSDVTGVTLVLKPRPR